MGTVLFGSMAAEYVVQEKIKLARRVFPVFEESGGFQPCTDTNPFCSANRVGGAMGVCQFDGGVTSRRAGRDGSL